MDKIDYSDPQCPFCVEGYRDKPTVHPIDVATAVAKINEHLNRDDYEGAEKVLNYWIGEAEIGYDDRGLLSLRNEQMGLLRKLGRGDEAIVASKEALALVEKIGFEGTITAATTYVNSGTVQKTFGDSALAIEYFEKAMNVLKEHYEEALAKLDEVENNSATGLDTDAGKAAQSDVDDYAMRLGSLYNNMALALADEGRYDDAKKAYEDALDVMARMTYGEREQAITYLNLADLIVAQSLYSDGAGQGDGTGQDDSAGEDAGAGRVILSEDGSHVESYPSSDMELTILEYVGKAKELLDTESLPRDGYHAFVLEKCAESFAFYGFNSVAEEYKKISRKIYNN